MKKQVEAYIFFNIQTYSGESKESDSKLKNDGHKYKLYTKIVLKWY